MLSSEFTFHYVSIKSEWVERDIKEKLHLHSTMYLLNPGFSEPVLLAIVFTFHYVSIKSIEKSQNCRDHTYLHSTMYLLNPSRQLCPIRSHLNLHSTMYLLNLKITGLSMVIRRIYIPLCIY